MAEATAVAGPRSWLKVTTCVPWTTSMLCVGASTAVTVTRTVRVVAVASAALVLALALALVLVLVASVKVAGVEVVVASV